MDEVFVSVGKTIYTNKYLSIWTAKVRLSLLISLISPIFIISQTLVWLPLPYDVSKIHTFSPLKSFLLPLFSLFSDHNLDT